MMIQPIDFINGNEWAIYAGVPETYLPAFKDFASSEIKRISNKKAIPIDESGLLLNDLVLGEFIVEPKIYYDKVIPEQPQNRFRIFYENNIFHYPFDTTYSIQLYYIEQVINLRNVLKLVNFADQF